MVEINVPTQSFGVEKESNEPDEVVELRQELQVAALRLKQGIGDAKLTCISWSEPENILKS